MEGSPDVPLSYEPSPPPRPGGWLSAGADTRLRLSFALGNPNVGFNSHILRQGYKPPGDDNSIGGVPERFIGPVLKTGEGANTTFRGFESLRLRQNHRRVQGQTPGLG